MRKFECFLSLDYTNRVAAIKVARYVFGFGLREAKDFCDGWDKDNVTASRRVVLTDAQAGVFLLEQHRADYSSMPWSVSVVKEFTSPNYRDLSALGSPPQ